MLLVSQGSHKIKKPNGAAPSELEQQVAQELYNIELSNKALKSDLRPLQIVSVREVEVPAVGKRALAVFVPFPQLATYKKIQKSLVEELEKKFSDAHVVFLGQRTVLGKAYLRNQKTRGPIPRSRTLKAVQEALLDDVVTPSEIVGKRIRVHRDGSKVIKVFLNPKDAAALEGKTETFAAVYKALTNKAVEVSFPSRHH